MAELAKSMQCVTSGVAPLLARSSGRYEGHFSDRGYNAVQLANTRDCWVASVHIENADNNIFLFNSSFATVSGAATNTRAAVCLACVARSRSAGCLWSSAHGGAGSRAKTYQAVCLINHTVPRKGGQVQLRLLIKAHLSERVTHGCSTTAQQARCCSKL